MERGSPSPFLSWMLVPVTAALVLSALSLSHRPYTGLVLRGEVVTAVLPGGPAQRAGFAVGDRLLPGASSPQFTRSPIANAAVGVPLALSCERGGTVRELRLVPDALPDGERRMMAALLAVASGFVLIGGWVWSERRDRLTRAFFLLCLAFACLLAPPPRLGGDAAAGTLYDTLLTGAGLYLPALFVHFFALFPGSGRPRGSLRTITSVAYGVSTALFGTSFLVILAHPLFPIVAETAQSLVQGIAGLWFALGLVSALVLFAASYRRSRSTDARRRLRVALAGTVLGALPIAALVALRNVGPGLVVPGERLAVTLTLLVPASFAWATAVHRVFEFRVALRAAAVLAVLAITGVLAYALGEWVAGAWRHDLGSGLAGGALACVALVSSAAGPASRALRRVGERLVPDRDGPTERLDASPAARRGTPVEVIAAACQSVMDAYHLEGCVGLELGRSGPHPVAASGSTAAPPRETDFTAALPEDGTVMALEDLTLRAPDRRALDRAGVAWLLTVAGTMRHCLLLGRRMGGAWLGVAEQRELRRFAGHLEMLLENARLRAAASTHGAIDRELSTAGAIQAHLLPRRVPRFRALDCAAASLACEAVGGDYYDFVRARGRVLSLAVGDAAGHGIPAALMSTWAHAAFRDQARSGAQPSAVLSALNRDLVAMNQPQAFVALLCARMDVRSATLTFSNAGLTPPLLRRRDGRFEELTESGLLLGVAHGFQYGDQSVELEPGDIVVLCSDGLTEARRGEEMFGAEGVRRVLDARARDGADAILRALLAEVQAYAEPPMDDVTVVVLKQLAQPIRGRGEPPQEELKFTEATTDNST